MVYAQTSAGSTPAASLKLAVARDQMCAGVVHIRGVYPRGLIEAGGERMRHRVAVDTSAGSTPAASLKFDGRRQPVRVDVRETSAGSTPAASLK